MSHWPFTDDPDLAVVSLKRIVLDAKAPVRYVKHDHDGSWQFLDGDDITDDDAAVLGLGEMIDIDPTLVEVACLPLGFSAIRKDPDSPWHLGYEDSADDDDSEDPEADDE